MSGQSNGNFTRYNILGKLFLLKQKQLAESGKQSQREKPILHFYSMLHVHMHLRNTEMSSGYVPWQQEGGSEIQRSHNISDQVHYTDPVTLSYAST